MTSATAHRDVSPATLRRSAQIALVGNPNTGKTTLFNRLTGARQRVGNYPGVTVEKRSGSMELKFGGVEVIDLPGSYSLAASSPDERIVIDVLMGRVDGAAPPDAIVCVVDATNLMRNLFLASQVADCGIPQVVALNMMDAAAAQGISIDVEKLGARLGVPVVPVVATKGRGIEELKRAIEEVILFARGSARGSNGNVSSVPWNHPTEPGANPLAGIAPMPWAEHVERALTHLDESIHRDAGARLPRAELLRILFDVDSAIPERLTWTHQARDRAIHSARQILSEAGLNPASAEAILRYARLGELLEGVVTRPARSGGGPAARAITRGESIDRLLTHRVWGLLVFIGLMWGVFQSIYTLAVPLMEGIDWLFGTLGAAVGGWFAATPMLQSLAQDGVIGGIGSVVIFLPQILILFFFIALLEDTGYMARAAFLMDKMFSWCGLNGRSFVPLLSSYACAIPGVMAARTIDDRKARLVTILIAPLMSCSARLPVYVLLIGAFIEPAYGAAWAGVALVAMHFVGLVVAIPVALILNRFVVRGKRVPFVMEMPPYRTPMLRDVLWRMWQSGMKFLKRAGTIIFAMTIIIWALAYFPRPESVRSDLARDVAASRAIEFDMAAAIVETEYGNELAGRYMEQSYLGRAGKALQPIFAPAGFDWRITVGVLASFPAREVIVATLGIVYNLGGETDEESADLRDAMGRSRWNDGTRAGEPVFTIPVAFAIMIFFALCMQCGSTVAVIAREAGWKWAIFAFSYMTILAWLGAVATYQVGAAMP
jgi:ferrous iron transport protein B